MLKTALFSGSEGWILNLSLGDNGMGLRLVRVIGRSRLECQIDGSHSTLVQYSILRISRFYYSTIYELLLLLVYSFFMNQVCRVFGNRF